MASGWTAIAGCRWGKTERRSREIRRDRRGEAEEHERRTDRGGRSTKFQPPSTREAPNTKLQLSTGEWLGTAVWSLEVDVSLELGCWNLALLHRPPPARP